MAGGESQPIKKAAQAVEVFHQLEVESDGPSFVSRGGLKLHGALENSQIVVDGKRCVDFGQSTGGFTDCLLQADAASVVGFDVGHDQLHASLKRHPRVRYFEGVNLKDVTESHWSELLGQLDPTFLPFELAVADLSFIALRRVLPTLSRLLTTPCECLFLVKPQFELGPSALGKNGLVKNLEHHLPELRTNITETSQQLGFEVLNFFECTLKGGDGNQEFFLHAIKRH